MVTKRMGTEEVTMTLRVHAPIGSWGAPQSWPLPGGGVVAECGAGERGSWP